MDTLEKYMRILAEQLETVGRIRADQCVAADRRKDVASAEPQRCALSDA